MFRAIMRLPLSTLRKIRSRTVYSPNAVEQLCDSSLIQARFSLKNTFWGRNFKIWFDLFCKSFRGKSVSICSKMWHENNLLFLYLQNKYILNFPRFCLCRICAFFLAWQFGKINIGLFCRYVMHFNDRKYMFWTGLNFMLAWRKFRIMVTFQGN